MSGDVQPRKRKDKKKKRDDEASHGVHVTKMGSDDVLLHVHEEHGTGGHWCAKIIFFSLMTILLGLVCLIILENRGISDVDTPLSESRFSNYFDGWVDEHRDDHDDHHDSHGSLEHDDPEADEEHEDDEDDHDEPFEEVADHSEGDDEDAAEEEEEDDNVTPEEEEDEGDNVTAENVTAEEEDEDDQEEEDAVTAEMDDNVTAEEADEENATGEDDNATKEQNEDDGDDDDEGEDDENDNATKETSKPASQHAADDDDGDEDPFDEDDDDGTFDSLEKMVDNDAAELELLKEKARQQAAESKQNTASAENDHEDVADNAASWASSLTIKIGVGLALALVARLVLIRKKPISNEDEVAEIVLKRRLTIATPDERIRLPEHDVDIVEEPPDDDYSEEEIEIEEEIEYIEEEEVEPTGEENQIDAGDNDYVPETFEQLNAMYRQKDKNMGTEQKNDTKPSPSETYSNSSLYNTTSNNTRNNNQSNANIVWNEKSEPLETAVKRSSNEKFHTQGASIRKLPVAESVRASVNVPLNNATANDNNTRPELPNQPPVRKEITFDMDWEKSEKDKRLVDHKKEVAHDMDYQPEAENVDYDEDDIYDDEDDGSQVDDSEEDLDDEDILDDEGDIEEADDEEVSEIDDSELMNRLEAKYGKLPAKEYESDEDPDDPTWTQIKPKTGGGAQSLEEDIDFFEKEVHRAHEDMMEERYVDALSSIERLIQLQPDNPRLYLAKAVTYDNYAEKQQSNRLLMKAIEVYKQYFEFKAEENTSLSVYGATAEYCVEKMKSLGQFESALYVYERWIDTFPFNPSIRNDLAVTYLLLDRLSDAKQVLENVLQLWPENGFALVHYGFVLKQLDKDYHNAAIYLRKGIESKAPGTQVGRFYFQLGESLQRMGRYDEAWQIFRQGADLKLYPSAYQRSLYNEPNLEAQPFWSLEKTSYGKYLSKLQANWLAIKAEGLSALSKSGYFLDESEDLKNTGDWKEFELFSRGQQRRENCLKAPITCNLINQFPAARDCKRGQVKFSVMQPGTHVWPHCGPTNCRLRAHLGLVVPNGTRLRVANEQLSWQEGKFLIFDDSFEHEVWHEGDGLRLVLIVDIWHPDLTEQQRLSLTPI